MGGYSSKCVDSICFVEIIKRSSTFQKGTILQMASSSEKEVQVIFQSSVDSIDRVSSRS